MWFLLSLRHFLKIMLQIPPMLFLMDLLSYIWFSETTPTLILKSTIFYSHGVIFLTCMYRTTKFNMDWSTLAVLYLTVILGSRLQGQIQVFTLWLSTLT